MKRTSAAMILALVTATFSSQAFAKFAAIAYSRTTGHHGYSYGFASYDDAVNRALDECHARAGGPSCELAAWVENGCVSLAKDAQGYWGATYANGLNAQAYQSAQLKAVAECRKYSISGACGVLVTTCSYY